MSDGLNRVILMGNVGTTPELRYTPAGVAVLNMRLATNESWRDKNKDLQERTEWHTVVIFGTRAEGLARVLTKGASLLVEGGLRTTSYEKDGQTRYRTEVHAREILFAGRKPIAAEREAMLDGASPIKPPPLALDDGAPLPAAAAGGGADGEAPGLAKARTGFFGAPKKPTPLVDELPF